MFARLKDIVERFKREIKIYGLIVNDARTPTLSKWLLGMAVAYAVILSLRMVPREVVIECCSKASL